MCLAPSSKYYNDIVDPLTQPLRDGPRAISHTCNHFFHEEDWEFAATSTGACPFCKADAKGADAGTAATYPPLRGNPSNANGAVMMIE